MKKFKKSINEWHSFKDSIPEYSDNYSFTDLQPYYWVATKDDYGYERQIAIFYDGVFIPYYNSASRINAIKNVVAWLEIDLPKLPASI